MVHYRFRAKLCKDKWYFTHEYQILDLLYNIMTTNILSVEKFYFYYCSNKISLEIQQYHLSIHNNANATTVSFTTKAQRRKSSRSDNIKSPTHKQQLPTNIHIRLQSLAESHSRAVTTSHQEFFGSIICKDKRQRWHDD